MSKQRAWVDGREAASLYRTPHRDEAVNEKFEVNSKDYSQRVTLVTCTLNDRGVPMIDPAILPAPIPKEDESLALDLPASDSTPTAPEQTAPSSANAG
ncbi:hypothetical protein KO507_11175 [Gilvimarinus agarilyticus]|uniref:hypothetical protein n=1 Tax=unclassified Gilvimarinus TaxID=2642066 RepID=UPI001C09527E|nr:MULTISPECIES: hypothetical protein [unclassified Gilvimarinus]MBU2886326.1 hypothetical protein [Gilvimarinus agarilyticus]MDO6571012.1 hypothetical protein [Gilvimarinus sp. 2_MG-2023]MDO6747972.1 hypothetical protein [Gilvimarinus sp. 1_MG-2023]